MSIRVAVVGAAGRMGSTTCRALADAEGLELVAAVDPLRAGQSLADVAAVSGNASSLVVADNLDALVAAKTEVAVEFTGPGSVGANLVGLLERNIHAVVGATGIALGDLDRARELAERGPARALVVPNFAIGAVLMMRAAAEAAKYLPHVEIIELHHDGKVDAPSGTALRTAELIAQQRASVPDSPGGDERHPGARGAIHADVRIHSVRLPGLVAHQEVILGGAGQTLTLRHDSLDRESFMPGVVVACQRVSTLAGLSVGLEHVL